MVILFEDCKEHEKKEIVNNAMYYLKKEPVNVINHKQALLPVLYKYLKKDYFGIEYSQKDLEDILEDIMVNRKELVYKLLLIALTK